MSGLLSGRRIFAAVLSTLCVGFACTATVSAGQAEDEFNQKYGTEYSAAVASRTTAQDDIALAKKLLDELPQYSANPELVQLICTRAYELCLSSPEGYPLAIQAVRKLGNILPAKRVDALVKECDIYDRQLRTLTDKERQAVAATQIETLISAAIISQDTREYDAGIRCAQRATAMAAAIEDRAAFAESQAITKYLAARKAMIAQTDKLAAKLKAAPSDSATRNMLICQLIVDVDDPAEAAKYVDSQADIVWRRYVPMLTTAAATRPAKADILELARWYASLAKNAGEIGKINTLQRARSFYEEFIKSNGTSDSEGVKARAELLAVQSDIEAALSAVLGGGVESPTMLIVPANSFNADYAANFPPANNRVLVAKGVTRQQFGSGQADGILAGKRTEKSWTVAGQQGAVSAWWQPAIQGRFILIFGTSRAPAVDTWNKAFISINGRKAFAVIGMGGEKVLIMDLGKPVPISSISIQIDARDNQNPMPDNTPGLSGIEIYADKSRK